MGQKREAEIDTWLRGGGLVVTASDRAARAIALTFARARRAEGLTAWPAPNILDWKSFVRTEWDKRGGDGRLLLNPAQEQALWAEIAGKDNQIATTLEGPRYRLASLAMEAHDLLCGYAPHLLRAGARFTWRQDAAAFSDWLAAFDQACRAGNLLSASRLALELIPLLQNERLERPPLLLAGFDRILPTPRSLLDTWGAWRTADHSSLAEQVYFHEALDGQGELAACALWCKRELADSPNARLLIVTQNAADRESRGQLERAFLKFAGAPFEFSLGVTLSQVALTSAAQLLLRWLANPLSEHEIDWLFSTSHAAASLQEAAALQAQMRRLRHRGLERPSWTIDAFAGSLKDNALPTAWVKRVIEAQRRLGEFARRPQTPLDWVALVPNLLETAGWPGYRALSSAEFQAAQRWQQAVENCASLGFDGRRIAWKDFLSSLARALDETLFTPESRDAPIQIAGPAESAGLAADAIWFLGATEDAWPAGGPTHPLLPLELQRKAGMPHATAQLDWELADAMTKRLLASAQEVHFSYAKQDADAEMRPSRLIKQFAGLPQPLPTELIAQENPAQRTVWIEDWSRVPFPPGKVEGGSSVLTSQSQCPFKAFATARLGAERWQQAEAGLSAAQRGQLLHAVLHSIWAGPPDGISSHHDLAQNASELRSFVAEHVRRTLQEKLGPGLLERMPRRYLELEEQRLTSLASEWLVYEATRIEFSVVGTEVERKIHVAGLAFDLRIDRIDKLKDTSLLVLDYKSGDVAIKSWDLPRPDDVQLPLYATHALDAEPGGLAFAKVRVGKPEFAGKLVDAKATLHADLSPRHGLVRNRLSAEHLKDWRDRIEQLARAFLSGDAEVDPRDYPKTCDRCGLQTLCRIQEHRALLEADEEDDSEEDSDE